MAINLWDKKLSPTGFSSLLAALISVISGSILWVFSLLNYSIIFIICLIFIITFFAIWFSVEIFIYKRLRIIYQKMQMMRFRRSKVPIKQNKDIITGISDTFYILSGSVTQEINQLRELEIFRKEYIGEVSHELKTPIFAIQGYLETLLDGALEDKNVNKRFIKHALRNVKRLNSLVQDLTIISQLESGEMYMEKEAFKIYELILDVLQDMQNKLTSKGRNIRVKLEATNFENTLVYADEERIRQVLINLIDNAIKYGKQDGTIQIILNTQEDKIKVNIKDDGPGIPAEHLTKIFDRFYRVDKSRSRISGGTGLGLAIVKKLIEAHEEHIEVKSLENVATEFIFTLQKA